MVAAAVLRMAVLNPRPARAIGKATEKMAKTDAQASSTWFFNTRLAAFSEKAGLIKAQQGVGVAEMRHPISVQLIGHGFRVLQGPM